MTKILRYDYYNNNYITDAKYMKFRLKFDIDLN